MVAVAVLVLAALSCVAIQSRRRAASEPAAEAA
jgi:hypothetical protein